MSEAQRYMAIQIKGAQLPAPVLEYAFDSSEQYRLTFAWPSYRVALEIEEALFIISDMESNCLKYSEAAAAGWCVLQCTSTMVRDGTALKLLERALRYI